MILLIAAIPDILSRFKEIKLGNIDYLVDSKFLPPITAIVCAFNEEIGVINTVYSLLKTSYKNLEVLVINDGSTDKTMELLTKEFSLKKVTSIVPTRIKTLAKINSYYVSETHPNIRVIDKEHSRKADTLNVGVNACTTPLFVTVDSDTILEKDSINLLVFTYLTTPNAIAVGGAVYVLNGSKYKNGVLEKAKFSSKLLVALQSVEYLRAFVFGRIGWKKFGGPLILSGAFTAFERQAVLEAGGFSLYCVGEDVEIAIHLQRLMREKKLKYNLGYNFSASVWTFVPETMNKLWNQRYRWHWGYLDSLMLNKKILFNPKFGQLGFFSYPFHFFGEGLGPLVEFLGYLVVSIAMYYQFIDWRIAILLFLASWGFASVLTMAAALISMITFNKYRRLRDMFFILFLVAFESFGYRQVLVVCRSFSTIRFFIFKLFESFKRENQKIYAK